MYLGWGRHRRQENQETTATVLARNTEGLARTIIKGTEGTGTAKKFLRERQQGLGGEKDEKGGEKTTMTSMLLSKDFPVLCLHGFIFKDK